MPAPQNFRSAFHGFNREDVVQYIEFVNNKHASELNQMSTEMNALYADLEHYRRGYDEASQASALLRQEQEKSAAQEQQIQALQQEIEQLKQQLEQAQKQPKVGSELEAYRRAERAERTANDRVRQLYAQANGALADATARTDEAACTIGQMTDNVCAQLAQLQAALNDGANTIRDTAAAMYAIKPISFFE